MTMKVAASKSKGPRKSPPPAVVYYETGRPHSTTHARATFFEIAKRLALLNGADFAAQYDAMRDYAGPLYFVPDDTLLSEVAVRLNIRDESHLFGGVVPFGFVATKAITHPRLDRSSVVPWGWSDQFAERVAHVVHRGLTAFGEEDAYRGVIRLLDVGSIRLKPTRESGACGQIIVTDTKSLRSALKVIDGADLRDYGVVLEENLEQVTTYSVGLVQTAGLIISYLGTQYLTPNNEGAMVYGGSKLFVVRGQFEALLKQPHDHNARLAIKQAMVYDAAAKELFPDLLVSRCNYDVAQGIDGRGQWRSGVLEQSWRLGGATGAEISALEAFQKDPSLNVVSALCVEKYGKVHDVPRQATVYFCGIDDQVGPLTKYSMLTQ